MKKLPSLPKPRSLPLKHRDPKKPSLTKQRPSCTESHCYNPETGQLTIKFATGNSYRYDGVDPDTFKEFEASPSKGAFINSRINDKFPCTRI